MNQFEIESESGKNYLIIYIFITKGHDIDWNIADELRAWKQKKNQINDRNKGIEKLGTRRTGAKPVSTITPPPHKLLNRIIF